MDNGQHFLVVDFVILLHRGQGLTVKCYGVPFSIHRQLLRQDCLCSEVQAICFDPEGVRFLQRH